MNNGNNTFTDMAASSGFVSVGSGRCLIHFDYDNDGDQDVILCKNGGALSLFRNNLDLTQPDTHWLRVFLNTQGFPSLAPNGIGSKVRLTIGPKIKMRAIDAGSTFLGVPELSAHFGLGSDTVISELRVQWQDGTDTVLTNVAVDQTITISPAIPCPSDINDDGAVSGSDLAVLLGQWGGPGSADLDGDGIVGGADLSFVLGSWGSCP